MAALIGFFGSAFVRRELFLSTWKYVMGISLCGGAVSVAYAFGMESASSILQKYEGSAAIADRMLVSNVRDSISDASWDAMIVFITFMTVGLITSLLYSYVHSAAHPQNKAE